MSILTLYPWDWKMDGLSLMFWMKTVIGKYEVEPDGSSEFAFGSSTAAKTSPTLRRRVSGQHLGW